ncbi:histidine kinase [Lentzea sp. NPDC006480]|uniref:sensor histidine kinase n=1 Tax=Lentzea sp. NPDC006480 TaxID=3157176 RepID=UPI00339E216C
MTSRPERSSVSRRLAYVVISVVFANYLGNAFIYVLAGGATPARIAGSLACLTAIGYLQLGVFSRPGADLRSTRARVALGALALLAFVPVPFFPHAWAGMPGFLAGSALLVLRGRARWVVLGVVAVANSLTKVPYVSDGFMLSYYVVSCVLVGLVVYGLSRLPSLVEQLETARSELAELAVSRERLRFAHELHDLLGVSLAAITLKVELARQEPAQKELVECLGIAREALANVRAVASSYREPPPADERAAGPAMETRFAQVLLTAVVVCYVAMATFQIGYEYPRVGAAGVGVALAAVVGTTALVLSLPVGPHPPLVRGGILAAMAVCVYGPQLLYGDPVLAEPGFLAGAAALLVPRAGGWIGFCAVVAGQGLLYGVHGYGPVDIAYGFMATMNHGLVLYALTRLRSMVNELHEARAELATAAVTQERLRFARDLHDLLGYSLSAITLKVELARRQVVVDPGRARQELAEVLEISRQALADVRSVALSYRELSFNEETRSAHALLTAADIEVVVHIDQCDQLPEDVKITLATVLREGVTNLLRHSKAERCEIVLSNSPGLVTMDITNDGIPATERKSRDGSGIGNLTTRVRALGGDLHAGLTPEHTYRLRAEIPLT